MHGAVRTHRAAPPAYSKRQPIRDSRHRESGRIRSNETQRGRTRAILGQAPSEIAFIIESEVSSGAFDVVNRALSLVRLLLPSMRAIAPRRSAPCRAASYPASSCTGQPEHIERNASMPPLSRRAYVVYAVWRSAPTEVVAMAGVLASSTKRPTAHWLVCGFNQFGLSTCRRSP